MRSRTLFSNRLLGIAIILILAGRTKAQIGVIDGPGYSIFSCMATAAGAPELSPEGYTELVGDILISCTGGPTLQVGAAIPTTNIVVYMSPGVPITSRVFGPGNDGAGSFVSEALLMIDEPGSGINTGAKGGYGPQAPQALCTTAQQQTYPGNPCQAVVWLDHSGQYEVTVLPNTSTPAQNIYQGEIGDFGANSVTFYNVPVLPPAHEGVSRTFRITYIRVPVPGGSLIGTLQAIISTSPNQTLPVPGTVINIGVIGPSMSASVDASPAGGGNPFSTCGPVTSPTLTSR